MKKLLIYLSLVAIVLAPGTVDAAEFFSGPRKVIDKEQTVSENYYSATQEFSLEGVVEGDLFTAAESVETTGTTTNDFFAAGANLDIEGLVQDDMRIAGSQLEISNTVEGETIVFGSNITLTNDFTTKDDLMAVGSMVDINGKIDRDVRIYAQDVQLGGDIGGNVDIYTQSLNIKEDTNIAGDLNYSSASEIQIPEGAQVQGNIEFSKSEFQEDNLSALFSQNVFKRIADSVNYSWLFAILVNLITSLILFALFKKNIKRMSAVATNKFGRESLRGLAIGIAAPIVIVILFATVLGAWLGVMIAAVYALFMILAKFGAGMVLGTLVGKVYTKKKRFKLTWNTLAIGVVLLALLQLVPFVGSVFTLLFGSVALGTLSHFAYKSMRNKSIKSK